MKAVRIHGKEHLEVDQMDLPEPQVGQVLLKMAYAGICGSDLHYYFDGANGAFVVREPLIPGHEVSGVVEHDPSGTYAAGTKVTVHPARFGDPNPKYGRHLWPNGSYLGSASTWPHTQGGMSEYLLVDDFMVFPIPDRLDLRAAALAEPLAVALHGMKIAGDVGGKRVLVSGSGPIGLLAAAAAIEHGASEVWCTDILDGPLERASALGASRILRSDREPLPDSYFDIVLECTGVPSAINHGFNAIERGGIFVQIGMMPAGAQPIALASAISKEIQIRTSFRFDDELADAVEILSDRPSIGDIVITHEFDMTQAVEAFTTARNSAVSGKVLVKLSGA